jgi:NAD(P)-dependent dehydrogenase (short-subunit alcohol dehydrogenase family)
MSFKNKTIVITGGAKGIGAGCAKVFHHEEGNIVSLDIDEEAGERISREMGERALFIRCDVSRDDQVKEAMAGAVSKFGGIDVLVNNAGYQFYKSVTETSLEEWDGLLNVNLKGAFLCAKYAIPYMQEQETGVVINMSSVQAFASQEKMAAYIVSKSALIGLTRSIAIDYAPNIRSVAICPGAVDTPMNRQSFRQSSDPDQARRETMDIHLTGRMAAPEEIGEFAAFVASDKGACFTGQPIRMDGGIGAQVGGNKQD